MIENVWRERLDTRERIAHLVDSMPTIYPERKVGHWDCEFARNGWINHICSECGWKRNTDIHVNLGYKFCPNCGARMR